MGTENRHIFRFAWQTILFAVLVVTPFAVWYACVDPFKVLYRYSEYYDDPAVQQKRIGLNKGMVTVNTYLNNVEGDTTGNPYNAFLLGSSVSCYYDLDEWKELLEQTDTVTRIKPFHFDSSSESAMSMARKLEYLKSRNAPVRYALIVLDPIILREGDSYAPFAIDPVEIRPGVKHFIRFHYTFFRGAVNADFMKSWIHGEITGEPGNIGRNAIYEVQPIVYDRRGNQERIPQWDARISADPVTFYKEHPLMEPAKELTESEPAINKRKAEAFAKVAEILSEYQTDYHLIISPNRSGVTLSKKDLAVLREIFGEERVHDYSKSFARYLDCDTMLYDDTHYRAPFASILMREVYKK